MPQYRNETEKKAELQAKALSIRDYMQEPGTMEQIMAALPKWLNADRFVRLFYTAMMQNDNLVECSKQSLLSCMIQAAQIGIEPVFGKAALIPYGKEVQLQLMYKGLIDVARRYADITITGHVVYECDTFDIEWGDNERLIHIPKFGKAREKSKKVGAYDIWKVGDVIRSRRFMTASEIIYIRDTYSKAWAKQGKTSIWGKHEDDMFLKTVIKGHCKLEPQCLEMERAVTLDDSAEIQRTQLGMGKIDELPMPAMFDFRKDEKEETPEPERRPPGREAQELTEIEAIIMKCDHEGLNEKDVREFIDFIAAKQEKPIAWVAGNALKSPESFIGAVKNRIETLRKKDAEAKKEEAQKPSGEAPSKNAVHAKEFWNLRKGATPSTGLRGFVLKNLDRIWDVYSEDVRDALIKKFKGFYPTDVFPTRKAKEETPTEDPNPYNAAEDDRGADKAPPFKNPYTKETNEETAEPSKTEKMGEDIRTANKTETEYLNSYDRALESVVRFEQKDKPFAIEDLESFIMEMAHAEGMQLNTFKADIMRSHQFRDYFDRFKESIGG